MLLEPIVSKLVAAELAKQRHIDNPDNLQMVCVARFRAGLQHNPLVYNLICSRFNRWVVSKLWGWLHLPPVYTTAKPFAHIWVDEKDAFAADPTVSLYGSTWYCLIRRLHRLKYELIETDVALERGEIDHPTMIAVRRRDGRIADISFVYRMCPWQAARIAADMVALNWGASLLYTIRHRYRSTEDQLASDLIRSILRACILPLQPIDNIAFRILEVRLQGYINELISSALNPLNTYRIRREHLVTVYYMARLAAEAYDDSFERLFADLYAMSVGRLEFRKFAPVYVF